jgi:hypothetical protein
MTASNEPRRPKMSKWVWVPALIYIGLMTWVFGPAAYDVYLKPVVAGYGNR